MLQQTELSAALPLPFRVHRSALWSCHRGNQIENAVIYSPIPVVLLAWSGQGNMQSRSAPAWPLPVCVAHNWLIMHQYCSATLWQNNELQSRVRSRDIGPRSIDYMVKTACISGPCILDTGRIVCISLWSCVHQSQDVQYQRVSLSVVTESTAG